MATIKISGASDDLIEVGGDVSEEYSGGDEPRFVVLHPTGDVFRVVYGYGDRGVWRVEHEVVSSLVLVQIERAPEGDDPDPYTDTFHVSGKIERVECWDAWPPSADEIRERVDGFFDARHSENLSDDQVARIWAILNEPAS